MAEWLGMGLQNPVHRFDSGRRLSKCEAEPRFARRVLAFLGPTPSYRLKSLETARDWLSPARNLACTYQAGLIGADVAP